MSKTLSEVAQEKKLEHYGIPGMRWGVRKARQFGSARKAHFKRSLTQKYGKDAEKNARNSLKKVGRSFKSAKGKVQKSLRASKLRKFNDALTDQKHDKTARNLINHTLVAGALAIVTYKALEKYT